MTDKYKGEKSKSREKKNTTSGSNANTKIETSTDSVEKLSRILSSNRKTTKERISAAAELGVLGTQDAENALLLNLKIDDSFIKLEVIKSLGMIGSSESLKRLNIITDNLNDVDRKQINFARKVIAFREGSTDQSSMPDINWKTQSLQLFKGKQVAEISGLLIESV